MANTTYNPSQADGVWAYAANGWAKSVNGAVNNVASNRVAFVSDDTVFVYTGFAPADADYGGELAYTLAADTHAHEMLGIGVTIDESTPGEAVTGYFARYYGGAAGGAGIELYRKTGRYNQVLLATFPVSARTAGVIGLRRVVGASDVTLYVYDGTTLLEASVGAGYSYVDSAANRVTGVGRIGKYSGWANSGTVYNVYVDDDYNQAPATDDNPNTITLADDLDAPVSSVRTSEPVVVSGINVSIAFTVSEGAADVNGSGTFVTSGTVSDGDEIRLRHTSSASYETPTTTTLTFTASGDTVTFTSVTVAEGSPPGGFDEPLYDVFGGAGESLDGSVSESGHTWERISAAGVVVNLYGDGAQVVTTGSCLWHSVNDIGDFYLPDGDYSAAVTYSIGSDGHSYLALGIYCGIANAWSGYYVRWSGTAWELRKRTGEWASVLLTSIAASAGGAGYPVGQDVTVEIGRSGNSVYLTVAGVTQSATDTDYMDGGTVAIHCDYANTSGSSYLKSVAVTLAGQPQIAGVTPIRDGESFTISGVDFGGAGSVTIGGVVCAVTSWADDEIVATAPDAAIGYGAKSMAVTRSDTGAFGTAVVSYLPPTGYGYVTLSAGYAGLPNRSLFYGRSGFSGLAAGDQIAYETASAPSGNVSLDDVAIAVITGAPASGNVAFDYFILDASDGYSRSTVETVTLTELENTAPVFSGPIGSQAVTSGTAFSVSIAGFFSDADGDPLTYSASGLPAGLSVAAGSIAGTCTAAAGSYNVTVTADDGRGGTASSNSFAVAVTDGIAPVISGHASVSVSAAYTAEVLTPSSGRVVAALAAVSATDETDGDVDVVINGLPGSMTIAGSPYSFTATAEDAEGNHRSVTGSLTIVLDAVGPVFGAFTTPQTVTLAPGGVQVSRDDPRVVAILDSVVATDAVGSVSVLNNCPSMLTVAASPITVTFIAVDQANNSTTAQLVINIAAEPAGANEPPVITSANTMTVQSGEQASIELDGYDPDDDAITWTINDDAPGWIDLSGSTLTAYAAGIAAGSVDVTVRATDERGAYTEQVVTISVTQQPVIDPIVLGSIAHNEPGLPVGYMVVGWVRAPYVMTFSGAGFGAGGSISLHQGDNVHHLQVASWNNTQITASYLAAGANVTGTSLVPGRDTVLRIARSDGMVDEFPVTLAHYSTVNFVGITSEGHQGEYLTEPLVGDVVMQATAVTAVADAATGAGAIVSGVVATLSPDRTLSFSAPLSTGMYRTSHRIYRNNAWGDLIRAFFYVGLVPVTQNIAVSRELTQFDELGAIYSWEIVGTAPSWATISGNNILMLAPGLDVAVGEYEITVEATESITNATVTETVVVMVLEGNHLPIITVSDPITVQPGNSGQLSLTATDANGGDSLTWSKVGTWPSWINLSGNTVTASPSASQGNGVTAVTVRVTDSQGGYSQTDVYVVVQAEVVPFTPPDRIAMVYAEKRMMKEDTRGNYFADMAVGSNLDYGFDWSKYLLPGDRVVSSSWACADVDVTLSQAQIVQGTMTVVFVNGGAAGDVVRITNTISTAMGRSDVRSINLRVRNR